MRKIPGAYQIDAFDFRPFVNIGRDKIRRTGSGIFGMDMDVGNYSHIKNYNRPTGKKKAG